MSRKPPNPAADHPDERVRTAFRALFAAIEGEKRFGPFRLRWFTDAGSKRVLLCQVVTATGQWGTIAAFRGDTGDFYISGAVASAADFDNEGWNPQD